MKPFRDKVIDVLMLILLVCVICFGLSALGPEDLQVQVEKVSEGLLPPSSGEAGNSSSHETTLSKLDTLKEVPMIDERRVGPAKNDSMNIPGDDLANGETSDSIMQKDSLVPDSLTLDSLRLSLPEVDSLAPQKADSLAP